MTARAGGAVDGGPRSPGGDHTPAAIRERLAACPAHSYLRDLTYGAIDGVVTTFAVVAGVAGMQTEGGADADHPTARLGGAGGGLAGPRDRAEPG